MKTLPHEYWINDYRSVPTFYQRYWVHRCLELLDADSSSETGLQTNNSADLLEELVHSPSVRPGNKAEGSNSRTFHYLLHEFGDRLDTDWALRSLIGSGSNPLDWLSLLKAIEEGKRQSLLLYTLLGNEKDNRQGFTKKDFARWLRDNGMAEGKENGIVKKAYTKLIGEREKWLLAHENVMLGLLRLEQQQRNDTNLVVLEAVTASWLVELISKWHFGPTYLSELMRMTFLRHKDELFIERLLGLFKTLRHNPQKHTVFFRIQGRHELGTVGQVDQIRFSTECREGNRIVDSLMQERQISGQDVSKARDFFFHGETSRRMIFATTSVRSTNIGSSVRTALAQLDVALKQARFEFERSQFTIDNVIYVYSHSENRIERFTRRQALADRYIARGHPVRFERFVTQLESLQFKAHSCINEDIVHKITDFGLQWHRHAIESSPPEIRFMNHWIELEQLFKTAVALELISKSPGDCVVQALSASLSNNKRDLLLRDLWGDLQRCDVFGSKPYMSQHSGRVRYTASYLDRLQSQMNKNLTGPYRRWKNQPVDIVIETSRHRKGWQKGYRIPFGYKVFVHDNQKIAPGEWLAGPDLIKAQYPNMSRRFFRGSEPDLVNTLYLVRHWREFVRQNVFDLDVSFFSKERWTSMCRLSVSDVRTYQQALRLSFDLNRQLDTQVSLEMILSQTKDLDARLDALGWPPNTGLRPRVWHVAGKLQEENEKLHSLNDLDKLTDNLLRNPHLHEGILFELFRGCQPDFFELGKLITHDASGFIELLPNQPLLQVRVMQTAQSLNQFCDHEQLSTRYVWSLDRMRRTRNALVHSGEVVENIDLLAKELYHFSKVYLRAVIRRLLDPPSSNGRLRHALFLDVA